VFRILTGVDGRYARFLHISSVEAKMKKPGKSIEVHWFDAGHGTSSVEEQIKHQELMLRFVYKVLRNR